MISKKKIAIIGFGKEGLSAATFLGRDNEITIFDHKPASQIPASNFSRLETKKIKFHFANDLLLNSKFDLAIRSPGVRPDNSLVKKLVANGAILTSPTQIFFDESPAQTIGVTGTKGKGTTATLIHRMLKSQNKKVYLAGNIGKCALDILPGLTKESIVVLELSSFQLFDLTKSPHVAVVLMITSEHLDWHRDRGEYISSKQPIVAYQKPQDYAIINSDFDESAAMARLSHGTIYFFSTRVKTNGTYLKDDKISSQIDGFEEICSISKVLLPGAHNLQNILAATAVAKIFKIKNSNITKVLKSFKGLVHRLQYLGETHEIKFYNDSYSTIPETTIAAIEAIKTPKILILGGSSKNSNFKTLGQKIAKDRNIRSLILIGQEAQRIKKSIENAGGSGIQIVNGANDMKQIVAASYKLAKAGDSIVLSPACASFDMFKNYQDRGTKFMREFSKLKKTYVLKSA